MRHAFSIAEAAAVLGVGAPRAKELARLAFELPRDVFTLNDLVTLRAAKELGDRRFSDERIAQTLRPKTVTAPRADQGALDFEACRHMMPWVKPAANRDAEQLFASAVTLEANDPAEAVDRYSEAVAADPHHADAHVNLGRLLHERGRLREAEAHYVAALVSRPTDVTATFNLAVVLEDLGRLDDAIHRYREAIALDATCVDAYFNLGRLYEQKGEKLAAIRHFKDYRRLTRER